MTDVHIRRAGPVDAVALARLRFEFRAAQDPATEAEADFIARCTRWMLVRLDEHSAWRCWVAEAGGEMVGTIWAQVFEKIPNPVAEPEQHAYISSVYVLPARRGAGLGSRLLETCTRSLLDDAVDAIILWPSPRSRSLYARHGFVVREDLLELRRQG